MATINQSEKAYQLIRQQLMARSVEAGSRLTEQAWAEKLSVNRSDVRQALARLRAEGAVVKGPRGGFFAREYSEEDVREINEVRFILESAAARLAAELLFRNRIPTDLKLTGFDPARVSPCRLAVVAGAGTAGLEPVVCGDTAP